MGLEVSYSDDYGNDNPQAYVNIKSFSLGIAGKSQVTVAIYKDKQASVDKIPLAIKTFDIPADEMEEFLTGPNNFKTQSYIFLKKHSDFHGAKDIIESGVVLEPVEGAK